MEKTHFNKDQLRKAAEQLNFTVLINNCCRELNNSSCYQGIPKYDPALADYFSASGHTLHLKFDFPDDDTEVFVPLRYLSESKRHLFYFPVAERNTQTDKLKQIDAARFLELVANYASTRYPHVEAALIQTRLQNSIDNIEKFLAHFQDAGKAVNKPEMSFVEAEQLLATGHPTHALTKGRQGFSDADLLRYSPETGAQFQLHYFLVHPDHVTEKSADEVLPSTLLKEALLKYAAGDAHVNGLLQEHSSWIVTLTHPWEAGYLLDQTAVKEMQSKGLLYDLGAWGPSFTPTSSVRTVYNAESDWMFKFSLHVRITSAERINHLHELYRGYHISRLLKTPWGATLQQEHPSIQLICDPAFIAVSYAGKTIEGFSTSIRQNPFKGAASRSNVSLLASLCQDGVLGQPARIVNIIEEAAKRTGKPVAQVAEEWFSRYLQLILEPVVNIFNKYGMACEPHQQNTLIEFDHELFPHRIYFRDNQSFLFRKSKEAELSALIPGLAENGKAFIPDERLFKLLSHYLVISNLVGLVNALGCNGLANEKSLLELLYQEFERLRPADSSGFVDYILESRYWGEKANLLTSLSNIDGSETPASVVQINFPNILHKHFFSEQLIFPKGKDVIYSRYFPKEDVVISIRPIDLDRDLEMLHEWFNREHAKKIWQMDWPIRKLENYYRTLLPGDTLHSYIGEANGEPTFNFEVYWAIRDLVGDYYEVLPTDYGTHQFIAPVDPKKKFASPSTQCMVDYVFAQSEVGKMVGEGSVDSLASLMNKAHVGFKVEKIIEMPHKKANLNFCYREWYWAKFPQNKDIKISPFAEEVSGKVL